MSLLFMDGFDMVDTVAKWSLGSSVGSTTETRYNRGRSLYLNITQNSMKAIAPTARVIIGAAIYRRSANSLGLYTFRSGGVTHVHIRTRANGEIMLYRGTTLILDAGVSIPTSRWAYLEAEVTVADTGGIIKLWIDGALVVDFVGDTRNAGTSTLIDEVGFLYASSQYHDLHIDDLYIIGVDGVVPNAPLGEVSIQTLVPSGPGSLTEQTPQGSANNWENVDNIPYSTTAYNYATEAGKRDLYVATDPIASLPDVLVVSANIIAARTDPGTAGARTLLKSGASTVQGPTLALTPNLTGSQDLLLNNPVTGLPWTVAELSAIEIGSEVL